MRLILIVLVLAAGWGCTTTVAVPVVKEALKCDAPPSLLAACGEPTMVKQGITFGELITVSAQDRASFQECALRHRSLAQALAACNASIEKFNAEVREINARNRQ
jgi:hypothetical protein